MTEDKTLFEKIRKVVAARDKSFEAEAEAVAAEDAEIIDKIQAIIEKEEGFLEAVAEKLETEVESESLEAEEVAEEEPEIAEVEQAIDEESPSDDVNEPEPLPEPPTVEHKKHWMTVVEEKFLAWNPRTKLGKFFAKDRHNAVLGVLCVLILTTCMCLGTDYMIPQNVTIKYAAFEDGKTVEKTIDLTTRANTVEGAIKDSGLELAETDYVRPATDTRIKTGAVIDIRKSIETKAEIVGKENDFLLIPGTVEENLKFNGVAYDDDDQIAPARDTAVEANTRIVVKEVHYTTEEKQEKVAAKSVVVLDPSLYSGTIKRTEGHDGEGIFVYKTTYVNGAATGTAKEVKKWITEPEDHALRLGTSLTGHTGTYTISQTFTANTTAYYMGENARGAAGGRCVYGTCAVDPSVFPYGTMFFVEGYGVAIANDCGGAVKGHILDLWMHSYNESLQWGRRHVTAYVLS